MPTFSLQQVQNKETKYILKIIIIPKSMKQIDKWCKFSSKFVLVIAAVWVKFSLTTDLYKGYTK